MKKAGNLLVSGKFKRATISRPPTSVDKNAFSQTWTPLNNTFEEKRLAKTANSTPKKKRNSELVDYNTYEIDSIRKEVLETGDPSPFSEDQIFFLIMNLNKYKSKMIQEENYDEAQKALKLINISQSELKKRKTRLITPLVIEKNQTNAKEDDIEEIDSRINEINEIKDKQIEVLKEHQNNELNSLDELWSGKKVREYRKASSSLLSLKKMELSSARNGDFEKAKIIHEEIVTQANKETQEKQKLIRRDYLSARKQLSDKHKREIDAINQSREEKIQELQVNKEKKIEEKENRENVLMLKSISKTSRSIDSKHLLTLPPLPSPQKIQKKSSKSQREKLNANKDSNNNDDDKVNVNDKEEMKDKNEKDGKSQSEGIFTIQPKIYMVEDDPYDFMP